MKGLFITFEGTEACGKSTQANLLAERLLAEGHSVTLTREPGGTAISEKIREILLDLNNFVMAPQTELLLFLAARNQHVYELIKPNLANNMIVIADRFSDSTIAYQGVARDIDLKVINYLNDFATYGLKPDLTFLLDIPIEKTKERVLNKKKDRVELESFEFHHKVRKAFLKLAKKEDRIVLLNGTKNIAELKEEIYNIVKKRIKEQ
ncbi:MAG: dTMP kinase [Candidatus Cloacimonetes bacterium]|nr:dTMP kinase [Candidatus Cloacimonadota bacterium]